MKEKIVDSLMIKIRAGNNYDDVKLEEIRYGLLGMYSLITKISVVIIISYFLNFGNNFLLFLLFYCLLRCVGFGTHAKTNLQCWFFTVLLLIIIPFVFIKINFTLFYKNLLWFVLFINLGIFSPADTSKRPIISKKRKLVFKFLMLLICIVYLIIMNIYNSSSNLILSSMFLEGLLVNPLGYVLMGQKVRFKLNDIYLIKQKKEGGI